MSYYLSEELSPSVEEYYEAYLQIGVDIYDDLFMLIWIYR